MPLESEAELFRPKSTLISFVHPAINKQIVDLLAQRQLTVFAMDCIPRISRAQVRHYSSLRLLVFRAPR